MIHNQDPFISLVTEDNRAVHAASLAWRRDARAHVGDILRQWVAEGDMDRTLETIRQVPDLAAFHRVLELLLAISVKTFQIREETPMLFARAFQQPRQHGETAVRHVLGLVADSAAATPEVTRTVLDDYAPEEVAP